MNCRDPVHIVSYVDLCSYQWDQLLCRHQYRTHWATASFPHRVDQAAYSRRELRLATVVIVDMAARWSPVLLTGTSKDK